jgi:hypothetical protein
MDFLSNLEKILVVLSPEIGESSFQKAEGRIPPILPRSRRRWSGFTLLGSSYSISVWV